MRRVRVPRVAVQEGRYRGTRRANAGRHEAAGRAKTGRGYQPTHDGSQARTGRPRGTPARAELERRARVTGGVPGVRQTPSDVHPERGRNYPARSATLRRTDPMANSRGQLAARADVQPIRPDPRSGELARQNYKARGTAPRPPSPLPGDSAKPSRHRRDKKVVTTGTDFSISFFGRPPAKRQRG